MRNSLILFFAVFQFSASFAQEDSIANNLFLDANVDYVYKTSIDIKENHLSGIVYMKRIGSDTLRVLMAGEMGNTIFDLTIYSKGYQLNNCFPQLKKRMLLKRLAFYFRAMTYPVQITPSGETRLNQFTYDYTKIEKGMRVISVFKKIQQPILAIHFSNGLETITLEDTKWNVKVELVRI